MTKVKAIADKFFSGNVENFLTEMAGSGFKVDGWSANTELPLDREDFRAKVFLALRGSGVSDTKFAAALSAWNVQTVTEEMGRQSNSEPLNSVQPGAIEKIEDAVVDAITVQNAGLQQLGEIQLEQEVVQARSSGVTSAIVLELSRLDGQFETQVQIRDILAQVNSQMHTGQKNKALSLASGLLQKIQTSYQKSNEANQTAKYNQTSTESVVSSIFQKLAGLNNAAPESAEGK
jgi:hypothetical protein